MKGYESPRFKLIKAELEAVLDKHGVTLCTSAYEGLHLCERQDYHESAFYSAGFEDELEDTNN